ncbi:MAG: hypothetical protein AAB249_08915 [Acidobacteriota bacterium]
MSAKYDVVMIGGGHNGLIDAAYLTKAGKKVLAPVRRHVLGGAVVTEEIFPRRGSLTLRQALVPALAQAAALLEIRP